MTERNSIPLILNVDDDEGGRYAVSRELRRGGYDVVEAGTGFQALELAADRQPDLVLLDVHLPDIEGFEVCRRLKSDPQTSRIPVLHISASYTDTDSRVKALNTGADGYLTEPVEPTVLNATVKSLLRMKEAEQGLRRAAGQWQSTFDAIADGVAIVSLDGTVRRANHAFEAVTAHTDIANCGLASLFPDEPGRTAFDAMLRSGRRESAECELNDKVLRVTCDPVIEKSGAVSSCVLILSDITESRRLEEQMRHAQKLESIGLLAGGIAHDFNNLLTGILGNASLALETRSIPEINACLHNVINASERAADLARQLLAYAGKGQYVVRTIEVPGLVREMMPLIEAGIQRKVEVTLDFAPDLPPIDADVSQLRQLLMNLVLNGAEAIGEGSGTVRVVVATREMTEAAIRRNYFASDHVVSGWYVLIQVMDNGCGMDAATQSRVFDPFFTTKFLGRGLGLAAALGIVRQHHGGIRLESTPGHGTTFEVLLPASGGSVAAPVIPPEFRSGGARTVLVVDDEEVVRLVAKSALEKFGHRVVLAENGRQGAEVFSRRPDDFAVVILDLTMPMMSGEETLKEILALRPDATVIIISGYDESDVMRRFSGTRVAGFLQKPFTGGRLLQKVREVLLRQVGGTAASTDAPR